MFDLPGFIAARLEKSGIGQFQDLGLCTYADPDRFYSYRRSTHRAEPDYGRHINAIVLAALAVATNRLDRTPQEQLPNSLTA